ncbi:MAG: hypothetical protein OK438_04410 [Thaumarchaeota archaeon]|nr:hypothetical protein [Nitrososphaerota archaeon]
MRVKTTYAIGLMFAVVASATLAVGFYSVSFAAAVATLALAGVTVALVVLDERDRSAMRVPRLHLVFTRGAGDNLHRELDMNSGKVIGVQNSGPGLAIKVRIEITPLKASFWRESYPKPEDQFWGGLKSPDAVGAKEPFKIWSHAMAPGAEDRCLVYADDAASDGIALGPSNIEGVNLLRIVTYAYDIVNHPHEGRTVYLSDFKFNSSSQHRETNWRPIAWETSDDA